jgi:hypothetical protein
MENMWIVSIFWLVIIAIGLLLANLVLLFLTYKKLLSEPGGTSNPPPGGEPGGTQNPPPGGEPGGTSNPPPGSKKEKK